MHKNLSVQRFFVLFIAVPTSTIIYLNSFTSAETLYSVRDLGVLPGARYSFANDINSKGDVVGSSGTGTGCSDDRAFIWSASSGMQSLGVLPDTISSSAKGINDNGTIVGNASKLSGRLPFVWQKSTGIQPLSVLPGSLYSDAVAVNNNNVIVGNSGYKPVQWASTQQSIPMILIDNFGGADSINKNGMIVGSTNNKPFIWTNPSVYQDLWLPIGSSQAEAVGVNSMGTVAGTIVNSMVESKGFVWAPFGYSIFDIGNGYIRDINDHDQVVGTTYVDAQPRAFIWDSRKGLKDVNLHLNASGIRWTLQSANAINNAGQIVGYGINPEGETRGFLLTPVQGFQTKVPTPFQIDATTPYQTPIASMGNIAVHTQLHMWDASCSIWIIPGQADLKAIKEQNKEVVVIAHGWHDSLESSWSGDIASSLTVQSKDGKVAILGWDWSAGSTGKVGTSSTPGLFPSVAADLFTAGLVNASWSASNGKQQGKLLAEDMQKIGIDPSRMQLIGHSNGSAVVGSAANLIASKLGRVERITLLDAPNLYLGEIPQADVLLVETPLKILLLTSVNAGQYVNINSAWQIENYFSNGIEGRSALGFGSPINNSSNVFNGRVYPGNIWYGGDLAYDHSRIHDWYAIHSDPDNADLAGVNWSILNPENGWRAGQFTEQGYNTAIFGTRSVGAQQFIRTVTGVIDTFDGIFDWAGQHAESLVADANHGLSAGLSTGSDGYLVRELTIPTDADFMTFDFKVVTPGAYLTVQFGEDVIFYENFLDVTDWMTSESLFVGQWAGETNELIFILHKNSDDTALIYVDNITFEHVEVGAFAVPEPASLGILGIGALGLLVRRRRAA